MAHTAYYLINEWYLTHTCCPLGELKYHTVCRVGGGFTYEELREFRAKLDKVKQPWSAHKTCPSLAPWKISKKDDQPDFFIPPCDSFVLQIKCAELVPSISFSAGVTCRFPRLQRLILYSTRLN